MIPINVNEALEKKLAELETAIEAGRSQKELLQIFREIKDLQVQKNQKRYARGIRNTG